MSNENEAKKLRGRRNVSVMLAVGSVLPAVLVAVVPMLANEITLQIAFAVLLLFVPTSLFAVYLNGRLRSIGKQDANAKKKRK